MSNFLMDFTLTPRTVVGVRRHVGVDGHTIDDHHHHSGNETEGKNEYESGNNHLKADLFNATEEIRMTPLKKMISSLFATCVLRKLAELRT